MSSAPFSEPLRIDPAVALDPATIRLPPTTTGPVHGAQFVVEIAGPKSVPASSAYEVLGPRWNPALGQPEAWVMAPADRQWRLMSTSDGAGSYDSLALAWDLVSSRGKLSTASARHLLAVAEQFAAGVQRRAFPFPAAEEVDRLVRALYQAQQAFDIGVEVYAQGARAVAEHDVWVACAALGLDLGPDGLFAWKVPGWEGPILQVGPVEEGVAFSLGAVQRGADHEALSIGFNVPASPDPAGALRAVFQVSDTFSSRLGLAGFDDEGHTLTPAVRKRLEDNLQAAVASLKGSGLEPGSPACRKLYGHNV